MTDQDITATAAGRRLFTRPAAVASCVAFVLIGMLQALYGPAVPGLRGAFGLSPSGARAVRRVAAGGAGAGPADEDARRLSGPGGIRCGPATP
ncbi:hypothetical protein ACWD5R_27835 [Streptomyces sp. NPDC002514]|uniref:hypothetical protein n=1 Tax=unclassified Streptomyces TaxID=2593676 RepID=UPI0036B1EE05